MKYYTDRSNTCKTPVGSRMRSSKQPDFAVALNKAYRFTMNDAILVAYYITNAWM